MRRILGPPALVLSLGALLLAGCLTGPTVPRPQADTAAQGESGVAHDYGKRRGWVEIYHPGRASHDSITLLITPHAARIWLRDLEIPTQVDSLTATTIWLTARYDNCRLLLRTYPGPIGIGSHADSLRGDGALIPDGWTSGHPCVWSVIRGPLRARPSGG